MFYFAMLGLKLRMFCGICFLFQTNPCPVLDLDKLSLFGDLFYEGLSRRQVKGATVTLILLAAVGFHAVNYVTMGRFLSLSNRRQSMIPSTAPLLKDLPKKHVIKYCALAFTMQSWEFQHLLLLRRR